MTNNALRIHTIATPGLGDRSYIAILDGWAVAVDVQRDLDRVEEILAEEKATLGAVFETHIHNDYLTGGLVLARRHQAQYVVPAGPRLGYSATRADDGTRIDLGPLTVRSITTPGHTDAHAAFSVHVEDGSAAYAFTGGSLLLGATGRSDLLGRDKAEGLARQQYWSVRRMARLLAPETRIMPTHGFGSFCVAGSPVSSGDTVADQLSINPAYLLGEDEFVKDSLSKLDAYPSYYAFMGPRNAGGVSTADLPDVPRVDLGSVAATAAHGHLVVDTRPRADWFEGHLAGSLSVDAQGALATWLGWVTAIDTPITLITESEDDGLEVVRELHRIGFDDIRGVHVARSLEGQQDDLISTTVVDFAALAAELRDGGQPLVIDTREVSEWRTGHVAGAIHVPAHDIERDFAGALPRVQRWLYCGAGFRATIAASILERLGGSAVVIDDSVAVASRRGVPWCTGGDCTDTLCTAGLAVDVLA